MGGKITSGGVEIPSKVEQGIGRKLGVATLGFKEGGRGKHIQEVTAFPVGGGADAWSLLARSSPFSLVCHPAYQFPAVRDQDLFPRSLLIEEISRAKAITACERVRHLSANRSVRIGRRYLIELSCYREE